ncbi:unnamed protein product [Rhizoctonia solani]|uniref:F-box domain-containing protein n=1 Tax=Rhizoctonia solani TaxID=456999 RepID=A0A8H3CXD0_9AGAM|nr:unnamed protein product [Rhizoctonia solani]
MESVRLGFGPRVPPEVLSHVLSWLDDTYDISDASRVCRAWYKIAFPHLHQHMTIRHIRYLHTLTVRLELETTKTELRVGPCLRALSINLDPDVLHQDLHRPLLARFERVLTHLTYLELLELRYSSSPNLMSIFRSFRDQCSQLRWVIIRRLGGGSEDDQNEDVFVFKNMKRLEISWKHLDLQTPSRVPSALIRMVEDSPELYELRLDLTAIEMDDEYIEIPWWPSEFFRHLQNPLVQLRSLEIGGTYAINWEALLQGSSQCSLRRFFEQHPDLHTIRFRNDEHRMNLPFEPSLVEHLFPSVIEFTGPLAICAGVMGSRLAEQLREVSVYDELIDPILPCDNIFETLASVIRPHPKLEGLMLQLTCEDSDPAVDRLGDVLLKTSTLDTILAATPNVWSILIGVPINWTELIMPLRRVPRITEFHFKDSKRTSIEDTLLFKRKVIEIFDLCPMLLKIIGLRDGEDGSTLNVYREMDRFGVTTDTWGECHR